MPRAKTCTSPPLSRTTRLPARRPVDQQRARCPPAASRRSALLPTSTTSAAAPRRRGEPVAHDDVGAGQQPPAAHGQQPGVAGAAADQRDRPGAGARDAAGRAVPVSSSSASASRRATARRGSRPALTEHVTSSTRATAGTQAGDARRRRRGRTRPGRRRRRRPPRRRPRPVQACTSQRAVDVGGREGAQRDRRRRSPTLGRDDPDLRPGLDAARAPGAPRPGPRRRRGRAARRGRGAGGSARPPVSRVSATARQPAAAQHAALERGEERAARRRCRRPGCPGCRRTPGSCRTGTGPGRAAGRGPRRAPG